MKFVLWFISMLALSSALTACSTQRPVLYPNRYLNRVGDRVAELDIEGCMRRAESSVSSAAEEKKIVDGVAMGAGSGAAVGAAGSGAAGATRSLIRSFFRKRVPGPVYKNFVNRCLRDKGYDPIGWN